MKQQEKMPEAIQQSLCFDFSQAVTHRETERNLPLSIGLLAEAARKPPTPLEDRFMREARRRWPSVRWRRYAPVSFQSPLPKHPPCLWYAPFLQTGLKLIVSVDARADFPYSVAGQHRDLWAQAGFRVLDFTEDFLGNPEESVWQGAMGMVHTLIHATP